MGLLSSCEKAGWLFGANKPPEGVICRMLSRLATNVAISRTFLKLRVHMLEQANRGLRQRSRRHQPEIIREQFGITQFVAYYCVAHGLRGLAVAAVKKPVSRGGPRIRRVDAGARRPWQLIQSPRRRARAASAARRGRAPWRLEVNDRVDFSGRLDLQVAG